MKRATNRLIPGVGCLTLWAATLPAAIAGDWPTVQHDFQRTGYTPVAPEPPYRYRWIWTDGRGGDLFTTQEWDNFELRFTYQVAWPANSGVWFRTRYQYDILKWKNPVACPAGLDKAGRNGHITLVRRAGGVLSSLFCTSEGVFPCATRSLVESLCGIRRPRRPEWPWA